MYLLKYLYYLYNIDRTDITCLFTNIKGQMDTNQGKTFIQENDRKQNYKQAEMKSVNVLVLGNCGNHGITSMCFSNKKY